MGPTMSKNSILNSKLNHKNNKLITILEADGRRTPLV